MCIRDRHIGYYYEEFDAYDGARQLINAIKSYDADFETHAKRNKELIDSLSPLNNCLLYTSHGLILLQLSTKSSTTC